MPKPPPRSYAHDVAAPGEVVVRTIGVVRSPHAERHGTPRQATVHADPAARPSEAARIELYEGIPPEALADLVGFERVWVVAWLHLNEGWNPTVRPPRGDRKRSLFATRAPHRPNPIALSAARIENVEGRVVHLTRLDLLDGTPVLDLKPYVPEFDAFPHARAGWLDAL